MSEEEKAALEFIKINNKHRYCDKDDVDFLLNLIENQQKELDNLKEIEKSHKEENGKLRVEVEKQKETNKAFHHFIVFNGGKDIEDVTATKYIQIRQEGYIEGRHDEQQKFEEIIVKNYISKDKIRQKIEENKKLLDECDNGDIRKILHDEIRILKEMLEEK